MDNYSSNKDVLEKILNNPIFASGHFYKDILRYLFKCYNQNYIPKEIDLAIEVFGKSDDFNPTDDTIVRVYFYRLRKKLKAYYDGPGKSDQIRVRIPKGHHHLEFVDASGTVENGEKGKYRIPIFWPAIIIFIMTTGLFLLWHQNRVLKQTTLPHRHIMEDNFIWSDFLQSELNTSIVIGELFSFYINKKEYNHEWLIRDDQINSFDNLQAFIKEANLDESDIYLPGWDIIPKSSVSNLLAIYNVLSHTEKPLNVKITSEVTLDDIRNNNIIFIGHFHNLKHLKKYLPNKIFHPSTIYSPYKKHPERHIRVITPEIDTLYQFTFHYDKKSALNYDYVLLSKVPGPNDNVFLFIISFLPLGRLEIIKILTNNKLLPQLKTEIQSLTEKIIPYFELLIEVKGYEEKGFETSIKHFFPLPPEHVIYN